MSSTEIESLLSTETFGSLGCSVDGKPYVFPMAYVYHDGCIYGQTSIGRKLELVRQNPHVCFQIHSIHDGGWNSVMCWGVFEELDSAMIDTTSAAHVSMLLSEKIATIQHQIGITLEWNLHSKGSSASILFRICIQESSGKKFQRS